MKTDTISFVFIVGNSRSGTTMMSRIFGNHPEIHAFNELHFFGNLEGRQLNNADLAKELLDVERSNFLTKVSKEEHWEEVEKMLTDPTSQVEVFQQFLAYETTKNNASVAVCQTPTNVYHLDKILESFDQVKIINMVRDPRDVLLSQKNKWKRKFLGANEIPYFELLRARFNYHPYTISKMWNTAVKRGHVKHQNVQTIRFEDLLQHPEKTIRDLCEFVGILFDSSMLQVANIGSSSKQDQSVDAIDSSKVFKWKKGGLSMAEIIISEKVNREIINRLGYEKSNKAFSLGLIYQLIKFPFHIFIAILFNINRVVGMVENIKRRISSEG